MFTGRNTHPKPVILFFTLITLFLSSCSVRHPDADGSLTFKVDDTLYEFKKVLRGQGIPGSKQSYPCLPLSGKSRVWHWRRVW